MAFRQPRTRPPRRKPSQFPDKFITRTLPKAMDVRLRASAASGTELFGHTPARKDARAGPNTPRENGTQKAPFLDGLATRGSKVPPRHRQVNTVFGPTP
eukprot:2543621-Pyramimonas_sp.AAC.1